MQIITSAEFIVTLLTLCRVLPIIIFLPPAHYIPIKIKLLLAISIAFLISPQVNEQYNNINIITCVSETFIGLTIGLSIHILFLAIKTSASIIAAQSGLSNATFFDSASTHQENILAKFFSLLILTLFFITDTFFIIFQAIADSYNTLTAAVDTNDLINLILHIIKNSFEIAIKIALPVLLVGSITYFSAGIIGKLIPNIQVFFIVMPLQVCIGMLILFLTLGGTILWFIDNYNNMMINYLLR